MGVLTSNFVHRVRKTPNLDADGTGFEPVFEGGEVDDRKNLTAQFKGSNAAALTFGVTDVDVERETASQLALLLFSQEPKGPMHALVVDATSVEVDAAPTAVDAGTAPKHETYTADTAAATEIGPPDYGVEQAFSETA